MISPRDIHERFVAGESISEIARKANSEPEFIEALIRALAVGIEIGAAFMLAAGKED